MSALDHPSVQRVQATLEAAGLTARVIALIETARRAEDAARAIGTALGSIVKSLVFTIDGRPVMALIAGDRRCDIAALPSALGLEGKARRADAEIVRAATPASRSAASRPSAIRRLFPRRSTPVSGAFKPSTPRPAIRIACFQPRSMS